MITGLYNEINIRSYEEEIKKDEKESREKFEKQQQLSHQRLPFSLQLQIIAPSAWSLSSITFLTRINFHCQFKLLLLKLKRINKPILLWSIVY